ncbi:hypothetical protein CEXT_423001 [Caerostris extrusa]|uniref:Uncharacterized protein n=1 Tax=Caerostris extrusa TaxID=172846 RepID=A0AAV4NKF4_CAEEX|nr:hypothetical protein CEXT_423001 [Caerostris extrusa]
MHDTSSSKAIAFISGVFMKSFYSPQTFRHQYLSVLHFRAVSDWIDSLLNTPTQFCGIGKQIAPEACRFRPLSPNCSAGRRYRWYGWQVALSREEFDRSGISAEK